MLELPKKTNIPAAGSPLTGLLLAGMVLVLVFIVRSCLKN